MTYSSTLWVLGGEARSLSNESLSYGELLIALPTMHCEFSVPGLLDKSCFHELRHEAGCCLSSV